MSATEPIFHEEHAPDFDTCWALLERVVASPQLKRANRMREFLLFVGQRTLKDGCDVLHEQEIGSVVFGRPEVYDTSADNIVRVNATDLRKRIEDYFETDGADEPLILEIPRGSYKPVFRSRTTREKILQTEQVLDQNGFESHTIDEPAPGESTLQKPIVGTATNTVTSGEEQKISLQTVPVDRRLLLLAVVVIGALSIGCLTLWMENLAMHRSLYIWQSKPAVNSFWSNFLGANPNTDVVLADVSFALIEDISKRAIPLDEYLTRNYSSKMQSPDLTEDRRQDIDLISQRTAGSIGDFRTAQRIVTLDPLGKNIHLYYSRDYSPSMIKMDNAILIGGRKSNPWVDLFQDKLNFSLEFTPDLTTTYIKNQSPLTSEQAIYKVDTTPNSGYSVVAYLPNPSGNGKVLVLEGTGSADTEGAGEFLTSEEHLENFQKLLHVTTLPYFEVLLKTTHVNGTPMDAQIIAYRTYPNLH